MKNYDIKIAHIVGYMLKVLKNKKQNNKYESEFTSIRHGNYNQFIKLIGVKLSKMIISDNCTIKKNPSSIEGECDFIGLIASGPSLDKFFADVTAEYGIITDADFSDEIYRKLVVFETGIRMHVSNKKLIINGDTLNNIIDKLSTIFPLAENEIKKIHDGRKFLNEIKHHKNDDVSWKQNVLLFEEAYSILEKYKIVII
jgi:hypothetical protein